jgi:RNA polymerase sigma-70 factor (ECF subfamily)
MENYDILLQLVRGGDKDAFALIFRSFYKDLVLFGCTFLTEKADCEDIIQGVFLHLWENRQTLEINSSLKSFLLRSVRTACLDHIRHRAIIRKHEDYSLIISELNDEETGNYVLYSDLQCHFDEALTKMPERLRETFEMHRTEGLKYREIAERLKVSERTVEVRISKAIELLRKYLKEFLSIIIIMLVDC